MTDNGQTISGRTDSKTPKVARKTTHASITLTLAESLINIHILKITLKIIGCNHKSILYRGGTEQIFVKVCPKV